MGRPLGKSAGGKYCSAVGCQNCQNRDGKRGVKFYRFPKNEERCKKWIIKVNRLENGTLWNPRKHSRLCSEPMDRGKCSLKCYDVGFLCRDRHFYDLINFLHFTNHAFHSLLCFVCKGNHVIVTAVGRKKPLCFNLLFYHILPTT